MLDSQVEGQKADNLRAVTPSSLYIHIPFCRSRCFYCDFNTYVAPEQVMEEYLQRLQAELKMLARVATKPLKTVFFGGGTPTLFQTEQLQRLLGTLREQFAWDSNIEVTMEANPGSVTPQKLGALCAAGVNRISFGAQTFSNRLLMTIGRIHDADTIRKSVLMAQDAGFTRINLDLMFGLPEQSLLDVKASLKQTIELGVEHISAYWLKVEEGTPFAQWDRAGRLPLPGEDVEGDMYDCVRQTLMHAGYNHYEVSNFAKQGAEARHNLVYWHNQPYFAAGAGAHGYVNGVRYENVKTLPDYAKLVALGQQPIATKQQVSIQEAMEDTMMLGLRLAEGVKNAEFVARHQMTIQAAFGSVLTPLLSANLLVWQGDALRLTEKAWPIANIVFEKFVGLNEDTSEV